MAQERLRNFQHPLLSFEHNKNNIGFHRPGRYLGFDAKVKVTGLTFNVAHTGSNQTYMNPNSDTIGPFGMYMTPQGTIIQETAPIGPFTAISNAGNANERIDLLYAVHDQVEVTGGQDATYVLLKGSVVATARPVVPDAAKHTPIGYLHIPANENVDINNCVWERAKSPDSGDNNDARLDYVNIFTKFQGWSFSQLTNGLVRTKDYVDGAVNRQYWELRDDGNTFSLAPTSSFYTLDAIRIKDVEPRDGFRINIQINERIGVRNGLTYAHVDVDDIAAGWRPVKFPDSYANSDNSGKQIKPTVGEIWELELLFADHYWTVMKIGGRTSEFKSAGRMEPWPGKEAKIPYGWLLCDGAILNIVDYPDLYDVISFNYGGDGVTTFALPNLKSRVPVGKDAGDASFLVAGNSGGSKNHTITTSEMPAHNHTIATTNSDTSTNAGADPIRGTDPGTPNTRGGLGSSKTIGETGGGVAMSLMQPYLVITGWIIKT